ncbi:MAG: hypothetical protein AB1679_08545 [Actinomycetota bacterium]
MGTAVHADEGASPSDEEVISRSAWGSYNTSRVFEPWAEIPLPFDPGSPMTDVRLGTPQPKCEARAAGYWASYALEEALVPGVLEPIGYKQNPTLARAANPPYAGIYGDAPVESEVAPAGKEAGPYYAATCPSPLSGSATARHFKLGGDSFSIGAATSDTKQAFKVAEKVITGETFTNLTDVTLGSVTIHQIGSWLKTDLKPDAAPVVSYKITLKGISSTSGGQAAGGNETVWLGNDIVLAGQKVPAGELVAQFNDQLKAHEKDLAQLGRYSIRILAPKAETDEWNRHYVEAPVVDAGFGLKARERQTGHFQAIRFGVSRFVGTYTEIRPGETSPAS